MAWNVSGELVETCNCNMLCPCWFGQADLMLLDQGYCATSLLLRIREGSHDIERFFGQFYLPLRQRLTRFQSHTLQPLPQPETYGVSDFCVGWRPGQVQLLRHPVR